MILQYARAYVWYVISRSLFADAGGRTAPWMWLKALSGTTKLSWCSAALAYLYRQVKEVSYFLHLLQFTNYLTVPLLVQLDDACRRTDEQACMGGCLILLSVWMWEHFSVGRPTILPFKPWEDHGNPLRRPTWAYMWDVVSDYSGNTKMDYVRYTNEFDELTPEQVIVDMVQLTRLKIETCSKYYF